MPRQGISVGLVGESVLVIPTSCDYQKKKKEVKSRPKFSTTSDGPIETKNYLIKGGRRAVERDSRDMFIRIEKDLKTANTALASELLRVKTQLDEEKSLMQEEAASMEDTLKQQQAQLVALEEEAKAYQNRIKDVQKRLRDEHFLRLKREKEIETAQKDSTILQEKFENIKSDSGAAAKSLKSLQHIQIKLQEKLRNSHKEICLLKSKLKDSNERLNTSGNEKEELQGKHAILESIVRSLGHRTTSLSKELKDLQDKLEAKDKAASIAASEASEYMSHLNQKLRETASALETERVDREKNLAEISRLQGLLTNSQKAATKHLTSAEKDKAEIEHLRSDMARMRATHESSKANIQMLEAENHQIKSAYQAEKRRTQDLVHEAETLQKQVDAAKHELVKQESTFVNEIAATRHTLTGDFKAREASFLADLNTREEQIRNSEERSALLEDACNNLHTNSHKLEIQVATLSKELHEAKDQIAAANSKINDLENRLMDAQEDLKNSEDRAVNTVTQHSEQVSQLQLNLEEQAQATKHWRDQAETLSVKLDAKQQEMESSVQKASSTISERDHQIEHLATSLNSLTERFRKMQDTALEDKSRLRDQINEMETEQRKSHEEMVRFKGDVAAAKEAHTASQREVTRLSSLVASKEADLQTTRISLDGEKSQRLQVQEELVEVLKKHKEEIQRKDAVAKELILAMETEEQKKVDLEQQAMVSDQRAKVLDQQLSNARKSLTDAQEEADSATSALHALKRRTSGYQSVNTTLLSDYDDWLGTASPTHKNHVKTVVNKNKSDVGSYSDRIATLMERRQSIRK